MSGWKELLAEEMQKEYFKKLTDFLDVEYRTATVYPEREKILFALDTTPPEKVKCVILGQDPYHEPDQAMGLSFSVRDGIRMPPSLKNIFRELAQEYGAEMPVSGDLTPWAKQGVLLLNSVLTVREGEAGSHRNKGWEFFTDSVIRILDEREEPVVFMLWGGYARSKAALIKNKRHLVLECAHPSPLSARRGFFGCGHFLECNRFLEENGLTPVRWDAVT